jgi:hypothetical protein
MLLDEPVLGIPPHLLISSFDSALLELFALAPYPLILKSRNLRSRLFTLIRVATAVPLSRHFDRTTLAGLENKLKSVHQVLSKFTNLAQSR